MVCHGLLGDCLCVCLCLICTYVWYVPISDMYICLIFVWYVPMSPSKYSGGRSSTLPPASTFVSCFSSSSSTSFLIHSLWFYTWQWTLSANLKHLLLLQLDKTYKGECLFGFIVSCKNGKIKFSCCSQKSWQPGSIKLNNGECNRWRQGRLDREQVSFRILGSKSISLTPHPYHRD